MQVGGFRARLQTSVQQLKSRIDKMMLTKTHSDSGGLARSEPAHLQALAGRNGA